MNSIKFIKVSKQHKNMTLLQNLNFEIMEGDVFGIIGNNGAGKSTLLKVMTNLTDFDGHISFFDEDILKLENSNLNSIMGSLIEHPVFYEKMTGIDFLKLSMGYKGVDSKFLDTMTLPLSLEEFKNKKIKYYSQGTKQKLAILAATIHKPRIIILDEPHNSLDPKTVIELREYLINLNKCGCTIILTSHIMSEISEICNSVLILENGSIKKQLTKQQVKKIESYII